MFLSAVNSQMAFRALDKAYNTASQKSGHTAGQITRQLQEDQAFSPVALLDLTDRPQSQGTYSPDMVMLNNLKSITEQNAKAFIDLVEQMLGAQSYLASGQITLSMQSWSQIEKSKDSLMNSFGFSLSIEFSFKSISVGSADDSIRAKAAALIADDGPLGVKAVSENILKFAKALSGGDPSKIDMLWNAALKGFFQVAALFGGLSNMPEVSQRTYEAINAGFSSWRAEYSLTITSTTTITWTPASEKPENETQPEEVTDPVETPEEPEPSPAPPKIATGNAQGNEDDQGEDQR
ncbi:MAG: hypothetical protein FWE76_03610 [Symbiobacteriaceae bacterium]|nr:hypothetical protein [Symbiobacteriaceae bacterium]